MPFVRKVNKVVINTADHSSPFVLPDGFDEGADHMIESPVIYLPFGIHEGVAE